MRSALFILFVSCWIFCPTQGAIAQNRSVSGTVRTSAGEPVQGVTVSSSGSASQATTDDAGAYRIEVSAAGQSLTFSAVGFETQELAIPASNVLNVVLAEAQTNLDEVVVVGYGTQ